MSAKHPKPEKYFHAGTFGPAFSDRNVCQKQMYYKDLELPFFEIGIFQGFLECIQEKPRITAIQHAMVKGQYKIRKMTNLYFIAYHPGTFFYLSHAQYGGMARGNNLHPRCRTKKTVIIKSEGHAGQIFGG